jgi:CRISPR system Cascade subunit CasC
VLGGAGIWVTDGSVGADGKIAEDEGKSEYLLFLGANEVNSVARLISERWELEDWDRISEALQKKLVKDKKKEATKRVSKELKDAFAAILNGGKALDIALFGRMLADMPEKNQYAACQVAHAISTHTVDREFDFYTAVDDLKPEDTAGADMLGTVEFNSACYYRYAVVDWEKLVENLDADREMAAKGLRAFIEGFIVSEPTGKQNTFAAHNPPEFLAVSVRRNACPRNLANAFELAIRVNRNESLTGKSVEKLVRKGRALQVAYGADGTTKVLNLTDTDIAGFGDPVESLVELLDGTLSLVMG